MAIEALLKGLKLGLREQTLLGVTGSGKSVTADTPVLIRRDGKIEFCDIGRLIDTACEKYADKVEVSGDSEYIDVAAMDANDNVEVWSFAPQTGKNSWKSVVQLSRHRTDRLLKIRTACGRHMSVTDSHNFYVVRDSKLLLVDGTDLRIGDLVPTTRKIPGPRKALEAIAILDYLDNLSGLYIDLKKKASQEDIDLLKMSYSKRWAIVNKAERIRAELYDESLAKKDLGRSIGANKKTALLPLSIILTPEILRFFGYYIAEGHAEKRYITFTTADTEVVRDFIEGTGQLGLDVKKRLKPLDYQVNSTVLARLMRSLCGHVSRRKRLPAFWTRLDNEQLAEILKAYFSGDGGIDGEQMTATTASEDLASDLQLALLRFGINARCRNKKIRYNGRYRLVYVICISGLSNLAIYAEKIGFCLERKQEKLQELVDRNIAENTNVDIIPVAGKDLVEVRKILGWRQLDLAEKIGVERSYISMLESGVRKMSRDVAQCVLEALKKERDERVAGVVARISALLENAWTPIKAIAEIEKEELVYDFAVADNETFFAGRGGLFIHNTFTMANLIAERNVPTLVLAHNKTLAAQLYSEFREFFPENEVHYFVSYFDYYQPEAYIASTDTYIEKDSDINEEIDRLRHAATEALLTRRDTIIVASVSCIYGIGNPETYAGMALRLSTGSSLDRSASGIAKGDSLAGHLGQVLTSKELPVVKPISQDECIRQLIKIQYHRNDVAFERGNFRVKGDTVDLFPASGDRGYRLEFGFDGLEKIKVIDPLSAEVLAEPSEIGVFPNTHYATPREDLERALGLIRAEFDERLKWFDKNNKFLEAQRLGQRVKYDLEMLEETGFVKGIENYSRHLEGRAAGVPPSTLLDYFPDDFLMLIDESHMSLPQVRGMYNGDRARKEILVEYGFRLPSALDNRPLQFGEFEGRINQVVYVSATPGEYELARCPKPAEQVIRPTGLVDPEIEVRETEGQIDNLVAEIDGRVAKGQRTLVTTLTKRMAEDLSAHLSDIGLKVAYIHSDVDTLERGDILRDLRAGVYDVLVGINLLREGLDLPEVSLVAILDADKEGF